MLASRPSAASPPRAAWRVALGGIAVALVAIAVVGSIRWAGPPIYDGDGWYHVKYAEILRHDGISRTFPWFQESFLKDRFADFNLLYHLALIPFTAYDPLTGARVASVLAAALTITLFWATARALKIPAPSLWSLALLGLAPELTYRLTYTRPFVVAIGLAIAGTGAILLGRRRLATAIAFVYADVHCSFHLLPCVALLHDVVRDCVPGTSLRERFRTTSWVWGGVAAASILTPYFPNNLRMWWVTNIEVLRASWAMGPDLRVGTEMLPLPPRELLEANAGVFVVFGAAVAILAAGKRLEEHARTLLPIAAGFLALAFLSQRFIEMAAPFTFLLAGVAARDALARRPAQAPLARRAVVGIAIVVAIALGLTWRSDRAAARAEEPPAYLEAGAWMKEHVPPGETVFNMGWDEFPELFYADGTHRYVIGQDATFMWVTDRARTRLWADLPHGRVADPYEAIHGTFGCRWLFLPARYVTFTNQIAGDPRFRVVWSNLRTSVVKLDD